MPRDRHHYLPIQNNLYSPHHHSPELDPYLVSQNTIMAARLLLLGAVAARCAIASSVACSASAPLSCHNTTTYDTCCLNAPGGHLLLTQFWDTAPTTGPSDSWTIHGLW